MKKLLSIASMFLLLSTSLITFAQAPARGNVAILLDLSGSMNTQLEGKSRRDVAIEALSKTVTEIDGKASVALYAFGNNFDNAPSSKAKSCEDINQLVDYGKNNTGAIKEVLSGLQAKGWTPLAKSIETIGADLAEFGDSEHHLIILSDGEESCNGDPVSAVNKLKVNGVNVIVNTIGLDVDSSTQKQLEDIAKAGGGEYFSASDSSALSDSLESAITKEVTTPQAEADFSADNTLPIGGSSFEDAVTLDLEYFDGEAYGLPIHVEAGKYLTYTLPEELLNANVDLSFGGIVAPSVKISESGEVEILEGDLYASFSVQLFDKRKSNIKSANVAGKPNESKEANILLDGQDVVYMFIGDDDEGLNKNSKVFFETATNLDGDIDNDNTSDDSDNNDVVNVIDNVDEDKNDEKTDGNDQSILYVAIGIGILMSILLVVLIVIMMKKKKTQ